MNMVDQSDSFIMAKFREFYHEVIHQKRLVASGLTKMESDKQGDVEDTGRTVSTVWRKLLALMEKQEGSVGRVGGDYVMELFQEAQFVMAALADEIFLHLDWDGKEAWQDNLLETRLFGSHAAGAIFFEKLDRLLQNRDPVYTELAKVYLMALALGFEGKYRGDNDTEWMDYYRRELFKFIFQREPDILNESRHFCLQAYTHNVEEGISLKLPNPRKWIFILGILALGLVLLSHGIWINLIDDLEQVLNSILLEA